MVACLAVQQSIFTRTPSFAGEEALRCGRLYPQVDAGNRQYADCCACLCGRSATRAVYIVEAHAATGDAKALQGSGARCNIFLVHTGVRGVPFQNGSSVRFLAQAVSCETYQPRPPVFTGRDEPTCILSNFFFGSVVGCPCLEDVHQP